MMADHEYECIYSKHQNQSFISQTSCVANSLCNNMMMESTRLSVSPGAPLNLATEQHNEVTTANEVLLQSSSAYELNQLQAPISQRVVMVTGLEEAVTMFLNSHGMDGSGDGGSTEEATSNAGYGETLMMFPESETVQQATTHYLDFEPSDSLQGSDGVVRFNITNSHHEDDEAEEISNSVKSSSASNADAAMMLGQTYLVSESSKVTLDSLLNGANGGVLQTLHSSDQSQQVIRVVDLIQAAGPNIFRLVTNPDGTVSFLSIPSSHLTRQEQEEEDIDGSVQFMQVQAVDVNAPPVNSVIVPVSRPVKTKKLPPGCPTWAVTLNDCERIGDSFRGWVETDAELDSVLTYFKQVTHSYWGTRQSPSQSKSSTRLMWKSQYVPFDGIPFINASSRAIVMECQYGPRRQSNSKKLSSEVEPKKIFRQSCPARIYIKKVRKFPEFAVDSEMDKKQLKAAMDRAFHSLKESNIEKMGEDRYYVQLPTQTAHEFHSDSTESFEAAAVAAAVAECPRRLHPCVSDKLRQIVSGGETRLYAIRNLLRRFVEKELFADSTKPPARHDLTYFPTVNDLQNNIHQAIRDIEAGVLPFAAPSVNVEIDALSNIKDEPMKNKEVTTDVQPPFAQKVTVMLCAKPGEAGQHVISRVETLMSDGTLHVSSSLPPELAHIISNVQHSLVPGGQDNPQSIAGEIDLNPTSHSGITSSNCRDVHPVCQDSSTDTLDARLQSHKFPSQISQGVLKNKIDPDEDPGADSHFSLDSSCDDTSGHLVEDTVEPVCVTEHWRQELSVGHKRFVEDDMEVNADVIKRKRLT